MCVLEYRQTAIAMNKPPKSGLAFDTDFEPPSYLFTFCGMSISHTLYT